MREDFRSQVENRLDDLFHEDGETMNPADNLRGSADHPLKSLKAMLLSVEWEITDSSMESLIRELKTQEELYQDDKIILTFLRLLGPIARYIKVRKGKSHPNATVLLSSVYEGLERVALSKDMSRKEKEKILLQEVEKFKKLKEEVIRWREGKKEEVKEITGAPQREIGAVVTQEPAPDLAVPSRDLFASAIEEIKEVIREEFGALRAEVKFWMDSR